MADEEKRKAAGEALKALGLTMEDVAALMQPLIAQAVGETLNKMDLPTMLNKVVESTVTNQITSLVSQIKPPDNGAAGVPAGLKQPPGGGAPGNAALQQLAMNWIMGQMAPKTAQQDPTGMDAFLSGMMKFQQASAMVYRGPFNEAAATLSTLMGAALKAGASPETVIEGLAKIGKQPDEPKPSP